MKNKKVLFSLLSVILVVVLVISAFSVFANTIIVDNNWQYEMIPESSDMLVNKYFGDDSAPNFPSSAFGYNIVGVSDSAFLNDRKITSCVFPDSYRSIGSNAFSDCLALTDVTVGSSFSSFSESSFYGCLLLRSFTFNNVSELSEIPFACFSHCVSLEEIVIPDGVKSIGLYAFGDCYKLAKVSIPSSVESINDKAFINSINVVIYGWRGTYAEQYAGRNAIRFVAYDDMTVPTDTTAAPVTTSAAISTAATIETASTHPVTSSTVATITTNPVTSSTVATITTNPVTSATVATSATKPNTAATGFTGVTDPHTPASTVATDPSERPSTNAPIVTSPSTPASTPGIPSSTQGIPSSSTVGTDPSETTMHHYTYFYETYMIGDADMNGDVNVRDATLIQKYSADLVQLSRNSLFLANCDGKEGVNVKDATMIQKYCAGFPNTYPVGAIVEL